MVYLFNSPVLTAYGRWDFCGPLSVDEARARLVNGFTSAIGHASSAGLLSHLLGVTVPVNRVPARLVVGDSALVLRLLDRLPEGVVLDEAALKAARYELGYLTKVA